MKVFFFLILPAFFLWVLFDLYIPVKSDITSFDPVKVGKLDADMWRSYYERKPIKLFFQLSSLVRKQFHCPYWRSYFIAFRAAKAAIVFQKGTNRQDYTKALPHLEKFYAAISNLSNMPFDAKAAAQQELEWWIIRRAPEHSTGEWEALLAQVAHISYQQPVEKFGEYARLRVQAMAMRDAKKENITEEDWHRIGSLLVQSWSALHNALK